MLITSSRWFNSIRGYKSKRQFAWPFRHIYGKLRPWTSSNIRLDWQSKSMLLMNRTPGMQFRRRLELARQEPSPSPSVHIRRLGQSVLDSVEWCSVCNSRPADGTLTIVLEYGQTMDIPACTLCVHNPEKVKFVYD